MQIIANPTDAVHLQLCVRSSACDLLHGGCSALLVFLRCSRQVRRAGPVLPLVPPPLLLSLSRVPRGACGWLPRPGVLCPRVLVCQSEWSVRSASSVR